ncbi:Hypp1282 [Branchiostoma lanceolatum]|uniref:Hypp1282 protein n=1 Tax=Branchiostoma lanceolatum TaxID=7740 RepID=A0A8J9ZIN7_BRALA|nr:Hypp1282 [Branchiostoma lanceolatum]
MSRVSDTAGIEPGASSSRGKIANHRPSTLLGNLDLDTDNQYGCTFDVDVCGWTIEGPISHGTGGCDHGWPADAFNGSTDPGEYICFYLENLPMFGMTKARFISPTINTTRHVVLSFAIGTVRPPNSTYMNIIMADEHGAESLVCSTSDLLLPWQRIQVPLGFSEPYKIVIEGVSNPPFFPNFGIDDVTLTVADPGTTTVGVPTAKCSLQMTTPSMTTATKFEQGETNGPTGIVLVPIVLGSVGGLLIVVIGAFCLWRKFSRKVSPESPTL